MIYLVEYEGEYVESDYSESPSEEDSRILYGDLTNAINKNCMDTSFTTDVKLFSGDENGTNY